MAVTVGLGSLSSVTEYVIVSDTGMKYVAPFDAPEMVMVGGVFSLSTVNSDSNSAHVVGSIPHPLM